MILAMLSPLLEILCIITVVLNAYLVLALIGFVISLFFIPARAYPYWWGPRGWSGLGFAIIWSILFYSHCGFLTIAKLL